MLLTRRAAMRSWSSLVETAKQNDHAIKRPGAFDADIRIRLVQKETIRIIDPVYVWVRV